jgi:predicted transcriptional regulator
VVFLYTGFKEVLQMAEKRTMTLNLTDEEMKALDALSSRYDMSKTAIIRKALRMYQVIDTRLQKGEKLFMEDEVEKKKSELLVL